MDRQVKKKGRTEWCGLLNLQKPSALETINKGAGEREREKEI